MDINKLIEREIMRRKEGIMKEEEMRSIGGGR
jgi:hypothetical protein